MKKSLCALFVLLFPFWTKAEQVLQFRVKIPLFVEVVGNEYPPNANGVALQTLTLRSNSPSTCVVLSARGYTGKWQSTTSDSMWSRASTTDGHRYCTRQRGQMTLNVIHDFSKQTAYWPVEMTVTINP